MTKKRIYLNTGKRKTSIAKAALKQDGTGRILVNRVPYEAIPEEFYRNMILEVVTLIGPEEFSNVDIYVRVTGGGRMSQYNAVRTAISKTMVEYKRSPILRARIHEYDRSLLSGDARHTEPKKFGGRSARSRRQKSYR